MNLPAQLDNQQNRLHFSMPSALEMDQLINFCKVMANAPFYQKLGPGGVMAIYLTAKEFNLPFMACLNGGLHTFDGKVTFSAQLINAMIVNAGHRVDVLHLDEQSCVINFKRCDRRDPNYTGMIYEYTIQQAQKAGYLKKTNWQTSPKDMLFSRCLTGGGRKHIPEVFVGVLVTGELIGDQSDAEIAPIMPINLAQSEDLPPLIAELKPKKIELAKSEGYDDFVFKHGIMLDSNDKPTKIYEFVLKSAEKFDGNEIKVINYAMKHEDEFIKKFNKWEEENYPKMQSVTD